MTLNSDEIPPQDTPHKIRESPHLELATYTCACLY